MHERRGIQRLIKLLLVNNQVVSVHDGEEWCLKRSKDAAAIEAATMSTEEDLLLVRSSSGVSLGRFQLVYGNSEDELIADHSDNEFCNDVWNNWIKECNNA